MGYVDDIDGVVDGDVDVESVVDDDGVVDNMLDSGSILLFIFESNIPTSQANCF